MKTTTNLMTASNEWASRPADQRFETLAALRERVHSRRVCSRAFDIEVSAIHVEPDGETGIRINSAITECRPSHWAFGQLAGAAGAPGSYLRKLPNHLAVQNLRHGLSTVSGEQKFMVLGNRDGGPGTLQAVTSTQYGRIWDADVVDAVGRIVDRTGGRFYNPKAYAPDGTIKPSGLYASDRDVFMFMIDGGSRLDAGPRAKLNRGFIAWNSETGARVMGLQTFLFNEVCGNHIVWGAQDIRTFKLRHSSGAPGRFDSEVLPELASYVERSAKVEETVIKRAIEAALPTEREELLKLASRFDITRGELADAERFAKTEEGQFATYWDLVQGLTASARSYEWVDTRLDIERRAGAILRKFEN